jgi:arsenate reductase (thioredoxin)
METPSERFRILFLCTWNAGRSIFAEYLMRDLGSNRFDAFSAGVKPRGEVSPVTLKVLKEKFRIDASDARSKSWEEFKDSHLDFIVSVSEQAEETSHAFPDKPILAHWPYDDPSLVQGSPDEVESAYFRTASRIRYRLQLFNNLSFDKLDRLRIELQMKELALEGKVPEVKKSRIQAVGGWRIFITSSSLSLPSSKTLGGESLAAPWPLPATPLPKV